MRFKQGQEIVCIWKGGWMDIQTGEDTPGPKYDEIVTCDGHHPENKDWIMLKEYVVDNHGNREFYPEEGFVPIITTGELMEELAECFDEKEIFARTTVPQPM